MSWLQFPSGQPIHRAGAHSVPSEFERAASRLSNVPAADLRLVKLGVLLSFSQAAVGLGWLVQDALIADQPLHEHRHLLTLWGLSAIGLAVSRMMAGFTWLFSLRAGLLVLATVATWALAAGYPYVALQSHRNAAATVPERAFAFVDDERAGYQRSDGTTVGGGRSMPPFEYGHCVSVQLLRGDYGFRWIRVVESPPERRRGQLSWPVRRADCFGDRPLATI